LIIHIYTPDMRIRFQAIYIPARIGRKTRDKAIRAELIT
jgi:hypothetical protein